MGRCTKQTSTEKTMTEQEQHEAITTEAMLSILDKLEELPSDFDVIMVTGLIYLRFDLFARELLTKSAYQKIRLILAQRDMEKLQDD